MYFSRGAWVWSLPYPAPPTASHEPTEVPIRCCEYLARYLALCTLLMRSHQTESTIESFVLSANPETLQADICSSIPSFNSSPYVHWWLCSRRLTRDTLLLLLVQSGRVADGPPRHMANGRSLYPTATKRPTEWPSSHAQ